MDGLWLKQFVEPQLLKDYRDYNDDFIGVLKRANKAAIDTDGIKFNKLINNVGFHVNRTEDFVAKPMTGEKTLVEWDKLDTDPTNTGDDELRAMTFNKDNEVRVAHRESFQLGVRNYAMHKLAPTENVDGKMPVVKTSGASVNGRKRLTYTDLISFLTTLDRLNLPNPKGWYMILNSHHRGDLWIDRANTKNYRDIVLDTDTGMIKSLGKIKFFENNDVPHYDKNGVLKSLGSEALPTDQEASVFFYAPNTVYHIDSVTALRTPRSQDTTSANPQDIFRTHTYGLCDKRQKHGFGAIVSDYSAPN